MCKYKIDKEEWNQQVAEKAEELQDWLTSPGILKKKWLLSSEPCDICIKNAEAGKIPVHEKFPSGHLTWPAHEGCCCDVCAVVED